MDQLKIYRDARAAEDKTYELVKILPVEEFYGLGNNLRRSSAAVSHYIMCAHRLYSYRLKLDKLQAVRREAEATETALSTIQAKGYAETQDLINEYHGIIKMSWGLTKWLKMKLEERATSEAN